MEPTLVISFMMLIVLLGACLYSLKAFAECKKIIKSMKKRSKKYIEEIYNI